MLQKIWQLTPIIIAFLFTLYLQRAIVMDPDLIRDWLSQWGVLTVVVYFLLQTLTIIVAPLGGFALVIAIFALYGPLWGTLIVYLGTTPAYALNFLIARNYGKIFIKKFVGDGGLTVVDRFTKYLDKKDLVLLKLLMGGYFDYIAYAAGLSQVTIKDFIVVNATAGIPAFLIMALALFLAPTFALGIAFIYIMPLVTTPIYAYLLHKKVKALNESVVVAHEV